MNIPETIKKYIPEGSHAALHGNLVVFEMAHEHLADMCVDFLHVHGLALKTMTATDERIACGAFKIFYVFGVPQKNVFIAPYITVRDGEEFPSMTGAMPQVHFYEREIKEFFGLNPIGHPCPERWILHANWPEGVYPLRKDFEWNTRPADTGKFNTCSIVEGEGIFEIPVGPVHAGIIEPGHFRFSMAGEEIISLEPRLGFVHKGTEKLFETLPLDKKIALSEHVSGDTSFTQSMAFCQALESLAGIDIPERAKYLRVIFSELERLTAHISDVGLILLGTSFNFGSSFGARLREMFLQMNEQLSGSRFLRGINTIGGVTKDIDTQTAHTLNEFFVSIQKEFDFLMRIVDKNLTIFNRLSKTGTLPLQTAKELGAVGIVAKGSGIAVDARKDFPYAAYDRFDINVATEESGDIYGRFRVRISEIATSFALVREALIGLPAGSLCANSLAVFAPSSYAVSIAEGWRGDIVYMVATNANGDISRVHVRDASWLNWPLFIQFTPGNVVLDLPLMNKSCNLSYSGNDK